MTKAIIKKARERNNAEVFYIRTGNVVTTSSISAYQAEKRHADKIAKINARERDIERFCQSY